MLESEQYMLAQKDFYDSANIAGLNGILKQYSSLELNGFEANAKKSTKTDHKKDKTGEELKKLKKNMFESYLKRSYFYFMKNEPFVLNTEELATISLPRQGIINTNIHKN